MYRGKVYKKAFPACMPHTHNLSGGTEESTQKVVPFYAHFMPCKHKHRIIKKLAQPMHSLVSLLRLLLYSCRWSRGPTVCTARLASASRDPSSLPILRACPSPAAVATTLKAGRAGAGNSPPSPLARPQHAGQEARATVAVCLASAS